MAQPAAAGAPVGSWWDDASESPELQVRSRKGHAAYFLRGAEARRPQDRIYDCMSAAYGLIAVIALVRAACGAPRARSRAPQKP